MVVGDFGLSPDQQEMQLAIWSVLGGAMFFSTDLTSLSTRALSLLRNQLVFRVARDWEGVMGFQRSVVRYCLSRRHLP